MENVLPCLNFAKIIQIKVLWSPRHNDAIRNGFALTISETL